MTGREGWRRRLAMAALGVVLSADLLVSGGAAVLDPITEWSTIDSGAATSSGGGFALAGTLGQPDAGTPLSGAGFTLAGGFWVGEAAPSCRPADLDCDGFVTGADLGILLGAWGTPAADLNGNGNTDGADLGILLSEWG